MLAGSQADVEQWSEPGAQRLWSAARVLGEGDLLWGANAGACAEAPPAWSFVPPVYSRLLTGWPCLLWVSSECVSGGCDTARFNPW